MGGVAQRAKKCTVIAFVGPDGLGKTTLSLLFAESHGITWRYEGRSALPWDWRCSATPGLKRKVCLYSRTIVHCILLPVEVLRFGIHCRHKRRVVVDRHLIDRIAIAAGYLQLGDLSVASPSRVKCAQLRVLKLYALGVSRLYRFACPTTLFVHLTADSCAVPSSALKRLRSADQFKSKDVGVKFALKLFRKSGRILTVNRSRNHSLEDLVVQISDVLANEKNA